MARPGGDEFAILLSDLCAPGDVLDIAAKIVHAFADPFPVGEQELYVTASLGASLYPDDGTDLEALLKNADTAMCRAKDDSGNRFQFYSNDMSVRAMERMALENALRRALKRKQFELFYQPKVDLGSGRIIATWPPLLRPYSAVKLLV